MLLKQIKEIIDVKMVLNQI